MDRKERPATFQIPGSGSLHDHIEYHKMLLVEFKHTFERAWQLPPMSPVHQKRIDACKKIKRRLNFHWLTAREQLDRYDWNLFKSLFRDPV